MYQISWADRGDQMTTNSGVSLRDWYVSLRGIVEKIHPSLAQSAHWILLLCSVCSALLTHNAFYLIWNGIFVGFMWAYGSFQTGLDTFSYPEMQRNDCTLGGHDQYPWVGRWHVFPRLWRNLILMISLVDGSSSRSFGGTWQEFIPKPNPSNGPWADRDCTTAVHRWHQTMAAVHCSICS